MLLLFNFFQTFKDKAKQKQENCSYSKYIANFNKFIKKDTQLKMCKRLKKTLYKYEF